MKEALLVIDIDSGCGWGDDVSKYSLAERGTAEYIRHVLADTRSRGELIVFTLLDKSLKIGIAQRDRNIHHSCIGCDSDLTHLAQFLEHRHEKENLEPVFIKPKANAFANTRLDTFLRERYVERVRLVGCNTAICVQFSAIGAVKAGFHVVLDEKGSYPRFRDENEKVGWLTDVWYYDSPIGAPVSVTIE